MSEIDLAIHIKSLREQLAVLAARLQRPSSASGSTLGDLHGLLAAESQSTPEEIDNVLFRGSTLDPE